jgi:hypothetical protein
LKFIKIRDRNCHVIKDEAGYEAILASRDSSGTCILLYAKDSPYLYPSSSLLVAVPSFHTFILHRHLSSHRKRLCPRIHCNVSISAHTLSIVSPLLHLVHFSFLLYDSNAVFVLAMDNYDKYS